MTDLNEARIEVVRRHMALEITHDWDGVLATFDHPRYELMGPARSSTARRRSGPISRRHASHFPIRRTR